MNLYLLTNLSSGGYDVYNGFVVRAKSSKAARKIAQARYYNPSNGKFWLDPEQSTCEKVSTEGDEEIILSDFHAG